MNFQDILAFIAAIGALCLILIGGSILISGLRKNQSRNDEGRASNSKYLIMGGVGMIFLALFVCLFITSALSTNFTIKLITILIGIICFGLPSIGLMAVSLRSKNVKRQEFLKE